MKIALLALTALATVAAATPAQAASIVSYGAPLDLSTFTTNGSATVATNLLSLTTDATNQAGSAYAPTMIATNADFGIAFDFAANTNRASALAADGFSFIFQSAGANALGSIGGGIGATQISPSAGVAFRSYLYNASGIFQNGNIGGMASEQPFAFDRSNSGHVAISYNAATQMLSYDAVNASTAAHASGTEMVDLTTLLGPNAYFGFTGATGESTSAQSISNVTVALAPVTGAVPEPATWAMMIVGMGAIGFGMRRSNAKFDAKIKRMTAAVA